MGPIVFYFHAKKQEYPQSPCEVKAKKVEKHFFGHLIPYNSGLRLFSEKPSGLNYGPYCPLHSCKKIRKILKSNCGKKDKKSQQKIPFLNT